MKHSFIKIVASATLAVITLSGCYFFPEEEKLLDPPVISPDAVAYSTFTARLKTIENITSCTGYVRSEREEECFFTDHTGQLKTIYVRPGDSVTEGDTIAEMNIGELEYLIEIQELKVKAAQLKYSSSGSRADELELGIEQNTLDMYRAEYNGSKLTAPMSGTVSYVYRADPGTQIDPYKVIVKIADPDSLHIEAEWSGDKDAFSVGDKVTITVDGADYGGKITYTPRTAAEDGSEDTKRLCAEFTGETPAFGYIGKIADIHKVNEISENAVVIPKTLIKTDGDRQYVNIFEDGEKKERDVTVGITNGTEAEIIGGLSVGEAVVIR